MAVVWRGVDTRLDRPVAVKVLDGAALAEPGAVQRFHWEARTVAKLTDPHVVSIYDVGSDGDRHYLVMELVRGHSLAARLADGPLPVRQAVDIAAQVCEALAAAHAAGVVHRDVKPGNILIDDKGQVKVCDFGIARLVGAAQPRLTAVGAMIGTSQYMAPEQVSGGQVDARTDLYALGCVLYTMLAGTPPFAGEAALSVAWQQLHQAPEPITARRPEVPAPLAALVDRLLAKEPAARPGSAAQVRAELLDMADSVQVPETEVRAVAARASAAVPTPTRLLPAVGEDEPAPHEWAPRRDVRSRDVRSRPAWAVPALLTAVALLLVAMLFSLWGNRPGQDPQRSATGSGSPTASPAPTTPPARSAPADEANPGGRGLSGHLVDRIRDGLADRLAAAREAVADEVEAGRLDPKTARDIDKELDKLERELAKGDNEKVTDRLRDLARKLDKLRREGKLDASDWESFWPGRDDVVPGLFSGDRDGD